MVRTFVDPISGKRCLLVVPDHVDASVWTKDRAKKIGVGHPGCNELADLSVELDAFYCPPCGWSGRISGAWAVDVIASREV